MAAKRYFGACIGLGRPREGARGFDWIYLFFCWRKHISSLGATTINGSFATHTFVIFPIQLTAFVGPRCLCQRCRLCRHLKMKSRNFFKRKVSLAAAATADYKHSAQLPPLSVSLQPPPPPVPLSAVTLLINVYSVLYVVERVSERGREWVLIDILFIARSACESCGGVGLRK